MTWGLNLTVQWLGLVGFVLLTIPAFHAAKYARLLGQAELAKPNAASAGQQAYDNAVSALHTHREKWTWWKSMCLQFGSLLSVASYAVAAYLAYFSPVMN
jgi:hypothetical protein